MENNINNKEKLIEYLSFIRDQETAKPVNEADTDLIKACVELLLELQGKKVTLSTEQIEERVRKIPFVDTATFEAVNTKGKVRKLKKKKILLIAAVIAILVTLLSIVSIAFEWNIFDGIKNVFGSIGNVPTGYEKYENGISFEKADEIKEYENIEQISEKENLGILIPRNLSDGLSINKIKIYEIDGHEEILVSFNDNNLSYIVMKNKNIPENILNKETILIGNITCYADELDDIGITQIHFMYNNDHYIFAYNDKQVLLETIENLEE